MFAFLDTRFNNLVAVEFLLLILLHKHSDFRVEPGQNFFLNLTLDFSWHQIQIGDLLQTCFSKTLKQTLAQNSSSVLLVG